MPIKAEHAGPCRTCPRLRARPLGFLWHYVSRHPLGHATVFLSVLVRWCARVSSQYGLKNLMDIVAAGPAKAGAGLVGFALLCGLVAADNLLWRIGGWAAAHTFVAVTGDIRRDLFASSVGPLAELFRRTPAGRAGEPHHRDRQCDVHHREHRVVERAAALRRSGLLDRLHRLGQPDDGGRAGCGPRLALGALIYRLARRGTPLHRSFAAKAAAVDGELVDVIGNMGVVRAFGAMFREQRRVAATIGVEMGARRSSLIYLERLRLIHAVITAVLIAGVVGVGHHAVAERRRRRSATSC